MKNQSSDAVHVSIRYRRSKTKTKSILISRTDRPLVRRYNWRWDEAAGRVVSTVITKRHGKVSRTLLSKIAREFFGDAVKGKSVRLINGDPTDLRRQNLSIAGFGYQDPAPGYGDVYNLVPGSARGFRPRWQGRANITTERGSFELRTGEYPSPVDAHFALNDLRRYHGAMEVPPTRGTRAEPYSNGKSES